MSRQIYVNLPVRDLERSKRFFTDLGFGFEPKFMDENAAYMVVSESIYVMLLTEPFFKTLRTKRYVMRRRVILDPGVLGARATGDALSYVRRSAQALEARTSSARIQRGPDLVT